MNPVSNFMWSVRMSSASLTLWYINDNACHHVTLACVQFAILCPKVAGFLAWIFVVLGPKVPSRAISLQLHLAEQFTRHPVLYRDVFVFIKSPGPHSLSWHFTPISMVFESRFAFVEFIRIELILRLQCIAFHRMGETIAELFWRANLGSIVNFIMDQWYVGALLV